MSAEYLFLRSQDFTPPRQWVKEYPNGFRDNDLRLGRTRYTAGENALAQADSEIGALHVDASKRLRLYRADATGDSSESARIAKTAVIRAVHHYDDFAGDPSSTVSVEGDLCVRDSGGADAWLEEYDGSTWRGIGVLAENRTTATSGSPAQSSARVSMRSQIWQGSTQTREWFLRSEDVDEEGTFASFLSMRFQVQGSSDELEAWRIAKSHAYLSGSDLCLDDMTLECRQTAVSIGEAIDEGFAGSIRTRGGYSEVATVVAIHNHWDARNVTTSSGATVTDACLVRFDAAAGTHKALDAESAGAKWLKVNEAGDIRYVPVLDSKAIPFASGVAYAEISTQDGEGTQTLTDPAVWYTVNQWLTDGLEVNATANAAGGSLVVVADGDYQVTATLSVNPEAGETYVLRIAHIAGPSSTTTIAEAFVVSASADVVSVAMHGLATLAAGDEVEVQVQNPTTGATAFVLAAGNFSFERKA